MEKLRVEKEETAAKFDELTSTVKRLEQENLSKDQEISSLTTKNSRLEADVEKLDEDLTKFKKEALDGAQHGTTSENLQRKVQVLEEEAETTEKQLREVTEKYVDT